MVPVSLFLKGLRGCPFKLNHKSRYLDPQTTLKHESSRLKGAPNIRFYVKRVGGYHPESPPLKNGWSLPKIKERGHVPIFKKGQKETPGTSPHGSQSFPRPRLERSRPGGGSAPAALAEGQRGWRARHRRAVLADVNPGGFGCLPFSRGRFHFHSFSLIRKNSRKPSETL